MPEPENLKTDKIELQMIFIKSEKNYIGTELPEEKSAGFLLLKDRKYEIFYLSWTFLITLSILFLSVLFVLIFASIFLMEW